MNIYLVLISVIDGKDLAKEDFRYIHKKAETPEQAESEAMREIMRISPKKHVLANGVYQLVKI